eukprot:Lithocolla_globosa_v1_NODE_955_length_3037_cov_5.307176.p3 type:complete len:109 gc:universal NODE_955_length_3037_cov_5.307176:1180-1506(+)
MILHNIQFSLGFLSTTLLKNWISTIQKSTAIFPSRWVHWTNNVLKLFEDVTKKCRNPSFCMEHIILTRDMCCIIWYEALLNICFAYRMGNLMPPIVFLIPSQIPSRMF